MWTLIKKTAMLMFFALHGYQTNAQQFNLSMNAVNTVQTGQVFEVEIRNLQDVSLTGFELNFEYDSALLQYVQYSTSLGNSIICNANGQHIIGQLKLNYLCLSPVLLSNDSLLLTIKFEVIGCGGSAANIELTEGIGYQGANNYTSSSVNVLPQIICSESNSQLDTTICFGQNFLGISVQKDTTVSEILADQCGCDSIIQYSVFSRSLPEGIIKVDLVDCVDEIYSLEFIPESINGNTLLYSWSDGSTEADNIVFDEGSIELIVSDEFSCQNTFSAGWGGRTRLDIFIDSSRSGFAVLLKASQDSIGPLQYLWNNGNISAEILVTESGRYSVIVQDTLGCIDSAFIEVELSSDFNFFIPDAFSPNEDNTNDYWSVFFGQAIEGIENLEIFDRWGGKLYSRAMADRAESLQLWNGYNNSGTRVDLNVVVYSLTLKYFDGRKVKQSGTLHIIQ